METNVRSTSNTPPAGRTLRIENPFTLKFGQVFTGFGIGCGVGIGVGRPLNLGAIPALQQVTSAARGATDAFSGVGRHVNTSLRRLGAKNIEAGIGCGVGFGHGFGFGLAIKPGVVHQLQACLAQALATVMMKFGAVPGLSGGQALLPDSFKSSMSIVKESSLQNRIGSDVPLPLNITELRPQNQSKDARLGTEYMSKSLVSKEASLDTSFGSRTEKVISGFLQNPLLKDDGDTDVNELAGRLRSENNLLQLVMKHQQVIEALREENEKLHQILIEELKVPASKLQVGSTKSRSPCSDCFECRRRERKLK